MKKDVIYIDIEDDVTAVIDKLKHANEKIVALVPPKGNAVLQSIVNLKLIKRAAANSGKQPVIVTSNQALTALAGGLDLYVAKTLQSKPVLASSLADDVPADEAVEVSDSIEELDDAPTHVDLSEGSDDEVELSNEELEALEADNAPAAAANKSQKQKKAKKGGKVPNFDSFRKKLLLFGGAALVLLVLFFIFFGRAKSSIVIRAETTPVDIAFEATFNANATVSDSETYNLKAIKQEKKQTLSQSFTPTGQKDIGERATGSVRFESDSFAALLAGINIPAGTTVTSSAGKKFTTNEAVRLDASSGTSNKKTVTVTAIESGPSYNGQSGNVTGGSSSASAKFVGSTSGGTTQIVKVVSQADVDKAKEALNQQDTNAVRDELRNAFGEGVTVIDDSFVVTVGAVTSEPGVDQQANEAKLTTEVTYSLLGVSDKDLGSALDAFVTSKMTNSDQQRVYENGLKDVKFEKITADGTVGTFKVTSTGHYGPQFDTEALKEEVAGKKFGEARAYLQDLPGVKGVDIKLSPFWARKLPGPDRIDIKLDVDTTNGG